MFSWKVTENNENEHIERGKGLFSCNTSPVYTNFDKHKTSAELSFTAFANEKANSHTSIVYQSKI